MKQNTKENLFNGITILLAIILFVLFLILQNNSWKLVFGGAFFIISGIFEYILRKSKFSLFTSEILGIMSIITAVLLPKQVNIFILLFYFLIFLSILSLFYLYRKINNHFDKFGVEFIFRLSYLLIFIVVNLMGLVMIKSFMQYGFTNTISPIDYIFSIELAFIALFSLFLFLDNLIRMIRADKIMQVLFHKQYRSAYSFFISLVSLLLWGGYFYINRPENVLLTNLLIVLGLSFFTSLAITNSLKEFLE